MRIARLFIYSSGGILVMVSIAKFISSGGDAPILETHDPLTGLRFQDLFRVVAGIETIVALVCFLSKRFLLPAGLVAWLGTSFLAYRVCLALVGYHRPCSCMGSLVDALRMSPQTADTAMKSILAYLLIGSYAVLFWLWRQRRKSSPAVAAG